MECIDACGVCVYDRNVCSMCMYVGVYIVCIVYLCVWSRGVCMWWGVCVVGV